ncbi:MAG TPA: hypothetical protein VE172_11805 [Stackebrandtia sp.]|jgi:hypothetical protein|uniref:hypothetical protein n=1 Tax=Stackebrandtia sp. TaxID=2023065 RepID=UPI002D487D2F|nr:hypothetical protein [Stackebrandtia sp.]HZE39483.1 hypothetical protein [Stackebrandtia sp.]
MTDTRRTRIKPVKDGKLPISELTSPVTAAGSPFGVDQTFPLPVDQLDYEHSEPVPTRQR